MERFRYVGLPVIVPASKVATRLHGISLHFIDILAA